MANKTTQVRKIVMQYGNIFAMYNDKRKNGERRLKFVFWDTPVSIDDMAVEVNKELTASGIDATAFKFISTDSGTYSEDIEMLVVVLAA